MPGFLTPDLLKYLALLAMFLLVWGGRRLMRCLDQPRKEKR